MDLSSRALAYGMFFGTGEIRREVPGFSVSLLSPQWRAEDMPLHTHRNASFILVLKGSYRSSAGGASRSSRPSLFFNPAGTTHRDSFELAQGRFLAISLSDQCHNIASDSTKLPPAAIALQADAAVGTGLRIARLCLHDHPDYSLGIVESLCWELLSNIAGEKFWSGKSHPAWLRVALELLQDQCARQVQITGIARQIGVHPVHLARTFRTAFHCTPSEYLARCRAAKAMALLRDSNLPLTEIALIAGFFDQSHLSKSFRRHFGIAPNAYRMSIGKSQPSRHV